jgi:DNA polymerase-3 subunit delta
MYKNEFDNSLRKGYFYKSIMLYGDEDFFLSFYTNKILKVLNITNDEKITLYQDEYNLDTCVNYLSQSSLFGDRNLLILKLNSTKIDKRNIEKIINATLKNENSYFILQLLEGNFKTYTSVFSKKNQLNEVNHLRFFKPNIGEALSILQNQANDLNVKIDSNALKYIYEHQNMNLSFSINDLRKLAIFDEQIDIKMINNVLFNLSQVTKESLIDKILAKKDFSEDLVRFLEYSNDEDSIKLLSYFSNHIMTLLEFNMFVKIHNRIDAIEILGFKAPPHIVQKYTSQSMRFSLKDFEEILNHILEMEHYIKSGIKVDKNAFIYTGLLKLKELLNKHN